MFPRNLKLPLRSLRDFFETSRKLRVGSFSVFTRAEKPYGVVVIVPKRVAVKATARHQQKRLVYAALLKNKHLLQQLQSQLVLFLQSPLDENTVDEAVRKVLEKVL